MEQIGHLAKTQAQSMNEEDNYDLYLMALQETFSRMTKGGTEAVYSTNAFPRQEGRSLFSTWQRGLPEERQRVYKCMNCRSFFERYGHLVVISDTGEQRSVFWDESSVPEFFIAATRAARLRVEKAKVLNRFLPHTDQWGRESTGDWSHLHVQAPEDMIYNSPEKTSEQAMTYQLEAINHVRGALLENHVAHIRNAVNILSATETGASAGMLAAAQWLLNLKESQNDDVVGSSTRRHNYLVRAVTTASEGFRWVRNSVWYSLLEDLKKGYPVADAQRRFKAKLQPGQFKTAQTAPSEGNIRQAEELFEKMGLAAALRRRYARYADLPGHVWQWVAPPEQPADKASESGLFGHLSKKAQAPKILPLPEERMTWVKFLRTVLPRAQSLEVYLPAIRLPLIVLTTQADPAAPPILPWDYPEQRNPFNWFSYFDTATQVPGSYPRAMNLQDGGFAVVSGVIPLPEHFYGADKYPSKDPAVGLVIEGARDIHHGAGSSGLFAGSLRSELHSVRHVVEADTQNRPLEGFKDAPHVVMLTLSTRAAEWGMRLRVQTERGMETVLIDRFE